MAEIKLTIADSIQSPPREIMSFRSFLQRMTNRWQVGYLRYEKRNGGPTKGQKYLSRLKLEVQAYAKTGNAEHLFNIANYAYLESRAPEHGNFHFDAEVASATRSNGNLRC